MADWILNFTRGGTKDKLAVGDRVLVYVGAPDRVFIGDGVLASPWHSWTESEAQVYPGDFGAGVALTEGRAWHKPLPLATVWPQTRGSKTNPNARWYGAAAPIVTTDFEMVLQTGLASIPQGSSNASQAQMGKSGGSRPLGYAGFDDMQHGSAVASGDFPDYVLRSGGKPVIAVEAKRIGHPLRSKEAAIVKYGSVLGLRWGLLTDGRYLQVYDVPVTGVAPEDRLVLSIDLAEWADREDFDTRVWPAAALLSKAAMATGAALGRHAARELIRGQRQRNALGPRCRARAGARGPRWPPSSAGRPPRARQDLRPRRSGRPRGTHDRDPWQELHGQDDALGGIAGEEPLPVGAVVVNTVPARTRPTEALRAMTRATRGAVVIESERGEADALAPRLLLELEP